MSTGRRDVSSMLSTVADTDEHTENKPATTPDTDTDTDMDLDHGAGLDMGIGLARDQRADESTPCVVGRNVGHRFADGPWLFADVDFTLTPGTLIGICGPSGSGKSTLLSIIAGFKQPTNGTVTRSSICRVRWVFQNPHGVPHRTAIDHVVQPLLAQGQTRSQAEDEALAIMSMVHLRDVCTREFGELSGGESQRLMLARAIASKPDLLLVDEPTAQLDQHTATDIDRTLGDITLQDTIVIVATHDPNTRAACTNVIDLAWQDHPNQPTATQEP